MHKSKTKIELFTSNQVKYYRVKNKLSQAELAFKIGVSTGFIGKVESQKSNSKYNLNHLNSLSKAFGCSPKEFLPNEPV